MPSYNHEAYVGDAIESVLTQTVEDIELLVVDDASADDSRAVIEEYAANDDRVRTLYHDRNQGIAPTVNDGMRAATGEYLALMASDDRFEASKLERQLDVVQEEPVAPVVWTDGAVINAAGRSTGERFVDQTNSRHRPKTGDVLCSLLRGNYVFGSSLLFERELSERVTFNEEFTYLNDYQFAVDLAARRRFAFIAEPLTQYRIHGENSIFRYDEDIEYWYDWEQLTKYFLDEYGHRMDDDTRSELHLKLADIYANHLPEGGPAATHMRRALEAKPFRARSIAHLLYIVTYRFPPARRTLKRLDELAQRRFNTR